MRRSDFSERIEVLLPESIQRDLVATLEEYVRRGQRSRAPRRLRLVFHLGRDGRVVAAELPRWSGGE